MRRFRPLPVIHPNTSPEPQIVTKLDLNPDLHNCGSILTGKFMGTSQTKTDVLIYSTHTLPWVFAGGVIGLG